MSQKMSMGMGKGCNCNVSGAGSLGAAIPAMGHATSRPGLPACDRENIGSAKIYKRTPGAARFKKK